MTSLVDIINFAAAVGGLVASLLGLALLRCVPYMPRRDRTFFALLFSIVIAYVASDLVSQVSLELMGPDYAWLSRLSVFCESLFSSMLMPWLTEYLLRCAGRPPGGNVLTRVVGVLWIACVLLLIAAQCTDDIYYFTADNVYHRGPFYPVLLVPPALLLAANLWALVHLRDCLTRRQRKAFAVYLLLPLGCLMEQMIWYGLLAIVAGTSASVLAMFVFILMDQLEAHERHREEVARQRAALMALQMRPHFIYNVMTSIYYLCGNDPQKAQQVTLDFTDYLRHNFDAVARDGVVPFAEELAHTRAYLAVEQARFQHSLDVEFDTPYTTFGLPPLTLQPIAENAVKHGVDPELPTLHVRVSAHDEGDASIVVVEDTGPGMRPDAIGEKSKRPSALVNIRERLEAVGASLDIASGKEGGTVVTIRMPKHSPAM